MPKTFSLVYLRPVLKNSNPITSSHFSKLPARNNNRYFAERNVMWFNLPLFQPTWDVNFQEMFFYLTEKMLRIKKKFQKVASKHHLNLAGMIWIVSIAFIYFLKNRFWIQNVSMISWVFLNFLNIVLAYGQTSKRQPGHILSNRPS